MGPRQTWSPAAYGEILGVTDEEQIRRFLDCLGHKKVKGHWNCPCGTGKRIRDCHVTRSGDSRTSFPRRLRVRPSPD